MGWTKDEVDKYVAKIERNTKDPTEKNLKGFAFARLYREAKDNNKAKRHLEAYLSVNETDFRGHRMMGQLFEETGNLEKALISYRRSLDLNNTQHDLVLKVVELYCQVPVDPGRARAWADRAARLYPGHVAVFKLRMHLLESAGRIDYDQMEDLISEELAKRPRDVELHIRLVRVYASTGRLMDAFNHCVSVIKTKAFADNQEWGRCAVDVFEKYMAGQDKMILPDRDIGPGHVLLDLHAHLLGALCQLLNLYLKTESIRECKNVFYRLDYCLNVANERRIRQLPRANHRTEWEVVLTEIRGQLYHHCGTLILKLAKENYITWPRALKLASVCYLTSTQVSEPEINTPWVAMAPKNKDALRWYRMACHRLSHSGHILGGVANKYGEDWLDECISDWCTQQGHDEIINTIYNNQQDLSKSFLAKDDDFFLLELNIPSPDQMIKYDEVCVSDNPRNLELIVWIGLHWHQFEGRIRPGVGVIVGRIFDGLRMDAHNIEQTAAETLCLRDLEAFLYAVIRTSSAKHLEDLEVYRPDYQPQILPQQLCESLSSQAQEQWWVAAYNLYTGAASVSHTGRVRGTVQRGLEDIRALGNHGLHVRLLIFLAFNFGDKASYLKGTGASPWHYEEHWKSLQARGLHYWKEVLVLLEKIERNENIPVRENPLFEPLPDNLKKVDIKFNIQKARLILGEAAIKEGRIEDAMEMFEQVKSTQGMWNLAQIYKYLANVEVQAAATDDLGSEAHSTLPAQEYYNCLNKARGLLLLCLEKVGTEERQRQILQDELNDIEDRLNEDPNKAQKGSKKQLDFRQLDFQASRSSTTVSDVQESEDNFWLDQPQDGSSKDLIAKLSEVTLNNGYLQEQMAIRDQYVLDLTSKVEHLESELRELKRQQMSGFLSPANINSSRDTTTASPITKATAAAAASTSLTPTGILTENSRGYPTESTPVAKPSVKSRLGPRIPTGQPQLPKIDSNFFAGLSESNSPERRLEQEHSNKEEEDEDEDEQGSEQVSPRHSTSCDDGIHFEPLISLPKIVEKLTGEEKEKILFSKRAKLYRFVTDDKSWKERGRGTMKILSSEDSTRFRILMRRDHTLKVCANHLITSDMVLKPAFGSGSSLVWTTMADYADEVPKVEQLAVRFKLPEEAAEFKDVFQNCKGALSGVAESDEKKVKSKSKGTSPSSQEGAVQASSEGNSLFDKFTPTAGSWDCSSCLVTNSPTAVFCIACKSPKATSSTQKVEPAFKSESPFIFSTKGKDVVVKPNTNSAQPLFSAPSNISFGPQSAMTEKLASEGSMAESKSKGSFSFEFKPQPNSEQESNQAKPNKSVFATQPAAPFPFTSTFGSPLKFSFGPTQAPSTTSSAVEPTPSSTETQYKFPTLFSAVNAPKSTDKTSTPKGLLIGSATADVKTPEGGAEVKDTPLTFSSSPNVGFGVSDDEDEGKTYDGPSPGSSKQATPKSTKEQTVSSQDPTQPAMAATAIMPQLFWQQQLDEKFKFGNLHKTQPLAGMAPAVATVSSILYPASFMLTQMTGKHSPQAHLSTISTLSTSQVTYSQQPEVLQGKPKESSNPFQSQKGATFVPSLFPSCEAAGSGQTEDYDDYSDDEYDSETEDTESYDSNEDYDKEDPNKFKSFQPPPLIRQVTPKQSSDLQKSERKVLTARSSFKKNQPTDDDCVIIYQVEPSKTDYDKAARLLLPTNFFNFSHLAACQGCLGCDTKRSSLTPKKLEEPAASPSQSSESSKNTGSLSIFGGSGKNVLSFSSFATSSNWASKKVDSSQRAFPMAGQQLFSTNEDEEVDPSEEVDIHFKPIISLPELIERKSGEDDHTLLFSERAKLYRFDAPSSMWKERGIGDIKLLLDNKSGRGRVVMRRDQVYKLCANHWVTKDMLLMNNSTSERSWMWQTLSDFSEEKPSQEKLAVRFKSPESAKKFKEVFDDLIAKAKLSPPTTENKKLIQPPLLNKITGPWDCDTCYCSNTEKDVKCVACDSAKPTVKGDDKSGSDNVTKVESKPVFTIGRGSGPEDDLEEADYMTSPSKTSPSKSSPSKASAPSFNQGQSLFGSGLGSLSSGKFNFRLELKPDDDNNKSPAKSPVKHQVKSPKSPQSPGSPSSHPEAEDDGIHFEPLIFLPKLTTKTTGEENEETQFCQRAKLFRYDSEGNQWKERGLGEVKILSNTKSGKSRILMRRENVLKICLNHQITPEMELKPKTEKSWVWNTLADFADEVPKPETLAIRFKNSQIALEFKEAFEKAKASHTGNSETQPKTNSKPEVEEMLLKDHTLSKNQSTTENAQSFCSEPDGKTPAKKESTSPSTGFLFGSSQISALSFSSVAANLKSSPGFAEKNKSSDFHGKGSELFTSSESPRKDSESEDHQGNDPHFEPIIPLPEKIEVKTGEEDEEVMFSHRAKLYRFDKDIKQWKERGVGDIKILYHNKNGRARVLMRRDQIHKICANHYITKEMILAPNNNSNKSFVWNTLADFSDEEVKAEQLAVRFKLDATAQEFKKKFEECKEKVVYNQSPESKTNAKTNASSQENRKSSTGDKPESVHDGNADSLLDKFKPKPGIWDCEVCCIPNKPTSSTCAACQSPNPGSTQEQSSDDAKKQSTFGVPLKPPQSTGFKFNFGSISGLDAEGKTSSAPDTKAPSNSQPTGFSFVSSSSNEPLSFGGSTFGSSESDLSKPTVGFAFPKPTGFYFGKSKVVDQTKPPGFSFGSSTNASESETSATDPPPVSFGSKEAPKPTGFNFTTGVKPGSFTFSSANQHSETPEKQLNQTKDNGESEATVIADAVQESLMEKFQPKQGAWECDICLIQNKVGSVACVACQNPKPGSEASQASSSRLPTVNFGGSNSTGFSFDSSKSKGQSPFSFDSGCLFGNNPLNNMSSQPEKGDESNQTKDNRESEATVIAGTHQESLMEKFQPKQGAWECDVCLIQTKAGSVVCIACQNPRPGLETSQAPSSSLPTISFGGSKPTGFSFDPSKSKGQNPFSFGSAFLVGDNPLNNMSSQPEKGAESNKGSKGVKAEDVKPTEVSFGKASVDNTESDSFKPQFVFGKSITETLPEKNIKKSLDLSEGAKGDADSTGSPEIEAIYCSAFDNTSEPSNNIPNDSKHMPDTNKIDPTIVTVVEPSNEEKERAQSLLLPEGFYLYERQPTSKPKDEEGKALKSKQDVPQAKSIGKKKQDVEVPKTGVFGSASSSSFSSFADVSPSQGFHFGSSKSKGFTGQGSQLFSSSQGGDEDENPSEERDIQFDPIVNLPKVEVKTGEENEEIVFSHRAKLYRFDTSSSTWKERGVGDIKILKLKDANKFRVLMRRDQIRKLCANHIITKDMKLVPNNASDRSWVWSTTADWSEEEPSPEQIAVRFKLRDTADNFKKVFEECQQLMSEKTAIKDSEQTTINDVDKSFDDTRDKELPSRASKEIGKQLSQAGEIFKTPLAKADQPTSTSEGHWECTSCYTVNKPAQTKCLSCGETNHINAERSASVIDKQTPYATSNDHENNPDSSAEEKSTSPEKPKQGFLFGTESLSSLSFSAAAKNNLFGDVSSTEPFSFKGLNETRPNQENNADDEDEKYHNVSGDHIHFDPIIPLPDTVEVVTGEENHELLFKERAKLFRFDKDAKQWKERGVGELKILSKNGRARIVMRRDQIHKLCANHAITSDMVLTPNGNSDRSWVWQTLADFSEQEQKAEQLAVRFKTPEIANTFKKTFEKCTAEEIPSSTTKENDVISADKSFTEPQAENIEDAASINSTTTENSGIVLVPNPEDASGLQPHSPLEAQSISGEQSRTMQKSVSSSKTITKQGASQVTTSSIKVEKTASQSFKETKVDAQGTKTKEEERTSFVIQDESISSSSGNIKPLKLTTTQGLTGSPPSIFNQQLLSQKGRGGLVPFDQSAMQPSFTVPQFTGFSGNKNFTQETISTHQAASSHSEITTKDPNGQIVEERTLVQKVESRKVETSQSVSSSTAKSDVKSDESQIVSCSPEITKLLQEFQDSCKE